MEEKFKNISFLEYNSMDELPQPEKNLLQKAIEATHINATIIYNAK